MAANSTNAAYTQSQPVVTKPGQEPKSSPAARWFSIIIALLLIALGVVAARELILRLASSVNWQSWLDPVLDAIALNELPQWALWAGIPAVIVGLILLYFSIRPRARTHRQLKSQTSLWARPVDIARLTTATAKRTPGVGNASTRVKGKNIRLDVQATTLAPGVEDAIRQSITGALEPVVGDDMNLKLEVHKPQASGSGRAQNKEVNA